MPESGRPPHSGHPPQPPASELPASELAASELAAPELPAPELPAPELPAPELPAPELSAPAPALPVPGSRVGRGRHRPWPINRRLSLPRGRIALVVVLLVFLCAVLFLNAIATGSMGTLGVVHASGSSNSVPRQITNGGPVIDTTHGRIASFHLRRRTIALTFDDGPDPTWTPKVLAVLRRNHVHATFFDIGARIAEHPALVTQAYADGNELGIHTFTHADMSLVSRWERQLQYSQTEFALIGATGETTSLLRFPYSATTTAIDDTYWPIFREAGQLNYISAVADIDAEDWARPGVARILANATPATREGAGAVVLMHDAGGNRAQTVAALAIYIPRMKRLGYTFTTLGKGLDVGGADATVVLHRKASPNELWRGRGLLWGIWLAHGFVVLCAWMMLLVGVLTVTRLALMLVLTRQQIVRRRRSGNHPPVTIPVSVVVPAYNESAGIVAGIRSLANSNYHGEAPDGSPRPLEVVVVDDGSTDGTADLVEALGLPQVRVLRVVNGGKAQALNIGTAATVNPVVVMVDGDTLFEPQSIEALVQPFADPTVGAVAGNVKVGNRGSLLGRWQHIEYVTGFAVDRRAYEVMRCMPTVPGAIGAFRREALEQVKGVSDDTLAEDTDLTIALSRAGWRVVYAEDARAWTETPATVGQLWTQRYRWTYGTMQAMWKHRGAVLDRGPSGRFGRVGLPFLALFGVVLPLLAPLIDVFLLYGLLCYNAELTALGWLSMLAVQLIVAAIAFRLDHEPLGPLWAFPLQQVVYRQLMYVVLIQSVATALTGARLRWQKLRRTGNVQQQAAR